MSSGEGPHYGPKSARTRNPRSQDNKEDDMISSEVFEKFTGTQIDATMNDMLAALNTLVDETEDAEVGSALLCAAMRRKHNWGNADLSFNHPRLVRSAITRHIERGNILLQCDENSLISSLQSIVPLSGDRRIKMNAECQAIATGAKDVSEYVRWTCAAEVVAKIMQIETTSTTCASFIKRLQELEIHHPIQIRHAVPSIAAGLAVQMPKRAGAAAASTDGQAITAPTINKVDEALTAWTADRVAGGEAGAPFSMRPDEITTAHAIVMRVVRQLCAAGEFDAVDAILAEVQDSVIEGRSMSDAEPIAAVTKRMNRATFAE